ncbi:mRNA-decapping enzyme-like protein [Arachis ipaensis]|uniref:mRNA-decapping enzyme-like protein n=1 Tax=Arachis ipaensis TaxID=130454 RepID=UPI000A2B382E|nr:mRNA-decapping enzyme-like protein [Arachis ipaensis]
MSQNGKLMPNLDQHSTKLLNLTVLQCIDPFVEEILITTAHVTFYEFNIDLFQWSRKDVEGSLFVVKRNTQPRFQFIVTNRRNTGSLMHMLSCLQSQRCLLQRGNNTTMFLSGATTLSCSQY